MINELTPEQTAKFDFYVDRWKKIGYSTEPCNFEKAKAAAIAAYKAVKLTPPEYFLGPVNGPYEAAVAYNILSKFVENQVPFRDSDHLNELVLAALPEELLKPQTISIENQVYGNHEYWLGYIEFFLRECDLKDLVIAQPLIDMAENCGWWIALNSVAIFEHRPEEIHLDTTVEPPRLSNETGPAIKFRGENSRSNVYSVRGVRVPKKVVDRTFTAADIDAESNAEVRRIMVEFYGLERYVTDSKFVEVNTDDFGTLYEKEQPGDEKLMVVKVIDATPQPDGTYRNYFLRVDPNAYGGLKTARAAVASTWRNKDGSLLFLSPEDYDPDVET
jgi:hypothetical protein